MLHRKKEEMQLCVERIPPWDILPANFYWEHNVLCSSVKDGLKDEIACWRPECPVLIDAQTGLGKTTFVYEELIPRALSQKKNVLILSNRIALSVQQKLRIMKMIDDPRKELFTELGIQKCEDFGAIRIITYHQLHEFLHNEGLKKWRERILYVVADEVHFFTADALFNRYCNVILQDLTKYFGHAIRIYMTATSWDVLKPLGDAEQKNYMNILGTVTGQVDPNRRFHHYVFPFNYSAYCLRFVSSLNDLKTPIRENSKEKWLVFCNSKKEGADFAGCIGENASSLDADHKQGREWNELTKNERFSTQVLVTTSVLDCGVNINDDAVKNVVLCTEDRTSFMQMAGRKRLKPQEKVTLWIVGPSKKSLLDRKRMYDQQLAMIRNFEILKAQGKSGHFLNKRLDECNFRDTLPFYVTSLQRFNKGSEHLSVQENELVKYVLHRRIAFLEKLLSGKTTFQNEVRTWFGKPTEEAVDPIKQLEEFYYANEGAPIPPEQQSVLRSLIVKICEQSGYKEPQPTRTASLKRTALNNRLNKIPGISYYINETSEGDWILVSQNLSQDSGTSS